MGSIPALSYTIRHSLDRLLRQHLYYEEEFLATRKLMMGYPGIFTTSAYGVVSPIDPAAAIAAIPPAVTTTTLAVSTNALDPLKVDVNPGIAVFRSGVWIELHSIIRQISLANTADGVPNVVYLKYQLESATPQINDYTQPVIPYTMRIGDPIDADTTINTEYLLIGVDTVDTYTAYPTTVTDDYVPLAIVTVQTVVDPVTLVTTTSLSVDHTRNSYTWNRPWFSSVDAQHRAQVGTGTVTTSNPHGTSQNDLTVGDFTALQLHLDNGMVLAEDKSIAHVPGYRCLEEHITNVLVDDAGGTITGFPNASYIVLQYYPVAVGRCWDSTVPAVPVDLAALGVPQKNIVVFPYEAPTAGNEISVYYTRVEACEPPAPNTTTFRTQGPAEQELVIAGGLGHTSLASTEETMGDAYQFPQRYEFFVDGDGKLLKTPQVVYCWKRLDDLGSSDVPTITPYGPGKLIMGLMGATDIAGLDVQIKVDGTDVNGAAITHTFAFDDGNWNDPGPIPNPTLDFISPCPMQVSTATFAIPTNISVVTRVNDGPGSGIMIWMAQTPYSNNDKMKDAAHVASVVWDGLRLSTVLDKRVISTTTRDELNGTLSSWQTDFFLRALAGGNATVYCEDFRHPHYHWLMNPEEDTALFINIPSVSLSKWHPELHGVYKSIGLPVNPASGKVWRVSLFNNVNTLDSVLLYSAAPAFLYYDGAWNTATMTPVAGIPGTYEATVPGAIPTRVSVALLCGHALGMALYG